MIRLVLAHICTKILFFSSSIFLSVGKIIVSVWQVVSINKIRNKIRNIGQKINIVLFPSFILFIIVLPHIMYTIYNQISL